MKLKLIFGIFTLILFSSLGLESCNTSDSSQELSGEYFYIDEGTTNRAILSHLPNQKEIYPNVIDFNFNPDFIIARQNPNYEEYRSMIAFNLRDDSVRYPSNSKKDILKSEKVADSILKTNTYYKSVFAKKINYWIIDIKRKMIFGPLSKAEYKKKRLELKIPEDMELKD